MTGAPVAGWIGPAVDGMTFVSGIAAMVCVGGAVAVCARFGGTVVAVGAGAAAGAAPATGALADGPPSPNGFC